MPPWATGRRGDNERPNEPPTIDYMMEVTNRMGDAIKNTHGKVYKVGQSRDVVGYAAGGTTEGWDLTHFTQTFILYNFSFFKQILMFKVISRA